jgi:hypothetical protein
MQFGECTASGAKQNELPLYSQGVKTEANLSTPIPRFSWGWVPKSPAKIHEQFTLPPPKKQCFSKVLFTPTYALSHTTMY